MSGDTLRELVARLKQELAQPLTDADQLRDLLHPLLAWLDLVDFTAYDRATPWAALPSTDVQVFLKKHLATVQLALVQHIAPIWADSLEREGQLHLLDLFHCPPPTARHASIVARSSYSILLAVLSPKSSTVAPSKSLHPDTVHFATRLLTKLAKEHPLLSLYCATMARAEAVELLEWDAALKDVVAVPSKASNAVGELDLARITLPVELEQSVYIAAQARHLDDLMADLASSSGSTAIDALTATLAKFVRQGYFSAYLGGEQHTFWSRLHPLALAHLSLDAPTSSSLAYGRTWQRTLRQLPATELFTIVSTLLMHLSKVRPRSGESEIMGGRREVKTDAAFLAALLGPLESSDDSDAWDVVIRRCVLQRQGWSDHLARIVACWASQLSTEPLRLSQTLDALLKAVIPVWGGEQMVQHEPEDRHLFLTTLIASALAQLAQGGETANRLPTFSPLLHAIQTHLGALRPFIRHRGMLIAELVSARSGIEKPLNFGDEVWAGDREGRDVCRQLRQLVAAGPDGAEAGWASPIPSASTVPAALASTSKVKLPVKFTAPSVSTAEPKPKIEIISSSTPADEFEDEPDLQSYAMPSSPTGETLADLEDSSGYTPAKKKPRSPVYIPDLAAYLRATDDADKLEMGLQQAAMLISKKSGWGNELRENAVDLAYALLGLQDNFDTDDFDDLRLAALTSLVVGCPDLAAPCIIEQYFTTNYSIQQRYAMLSALALGARQLAGLPSLEVTPAYSKALGASDASAFPSKTLPPKLHRQLAPSATPIDCLSAAITASALSETKAEVEETVPEAARHKMLTVRKSAALAAKLGNGVEATSRKDDYGSSLAVECFIMPLINRFWLYLRDLATAPRMSNASVMNGGSGSAILLDPLVLTKYLGTLAILLDAGRLSSSFLAILAPETLELLLALRSSGGESTVTAASLEVALVVLDGGVRLDQGRTLAQRFAPLLGQVQAWATEAWRSEEAANDVGKVGRAAAGVLLRVDQIFERFRSAAAVMGY